MSLLHFSLQGLSESPAKFAAKVRNFSLIIDEPEALGGTDQAPNPVEYILAGYAGCLNVVAHLVAQELAIELRSLHIDIQGEIDPARLFGQATEARAGYQYLLVAITADTDADEVTLAHWLNIVEQRCPVNDNLQNATPIGITVQKINSEKLSEKIYPLEKRLN